MLSKVWVYELTIEDTALKNLCRWAAPLVLMCERECVLTLIWMSSRPVPNMSARQWSLPTVDNTSGLILRLCLWCSLSVARTEFLSISQTHTNTHSDTVWRSTHPYPAFCLSSSPFHFLFIFSTSHSLFLLTCFSLSFCSFSFSCLSPTFLIFPREVYFFNTPQQPFPFGAVVDWITGLSLLTTKKYSCDVLRL